MPTRKSHPPLRLEVLPQPDDTTCGPTCLHAVYRYWGDHVDLEQVVAEVKHLPSGGTLAVSLACHALRRGYRAVIYTYNLQIFDPVWFEKGMDLGERLRKQREAKQDEKLRLATDHYLEYLELGGIVRYRPLTPRFLAGLIRRRIPLLTGLSATYLYDSIREHNDVDDDIRGVPMGHFVVLGGYDRKGRKVTVADPLHDNPRFGSRYYRVGMDRLIASILLGILTYDANLLIVTPRKSG